MQDCLEKFDRVRFISSIDLSSGYWQVKITKEAKDKPSFYDADGDL